MSRRAAAGATMQSSALYERAALPLALSCAPRAPAALLVYFASHETCLPRAADGAPQNKLLVCIQAHTEPPSPSHCALL